MAVYIVAQVEIKDRESYGKYEDGFLDIFLQYKGEILAADEATDVIEGAWPATRTVILRFPDEAEARRWYESPEYQKIVRDRWAGADANIALVHGLG